MPVDHELYSYTVNEKNSASHGDRHAVSTELLSFVTCLDVYPYDRCCLTLRIEGICSFSAASFLEVACTIEKRRRQREATTEVFVVVLAVGVHHSPRGSEFVPRSGVGTLRVALVGIADVLGRVEHHAKDETLYE